jgi:hypothetical protein
LGKYWNWHEKNLHGGVTVQVVLMIRTCIIWGEGISRYSPHHQFLRLYSRFGVDIFKYKVAFIKQM